MAPSARAFGAGLRPWPSATISYYLCNFCHPGILRGEWQPRAYTGDIWFASGVAAVTPAGGSSLATAHQTSGAAWRPSWERHGVVLMDVDLGDVHVLGLQPAPCSSSTRSACTGSLPPASSPRGTREAFVLSNSNRPTSINCVHGFVNLRLSSHLFHKLDFFQWELIFVRHYNTGTCRLLWAYFGPLRFISQGLPNERRVLQ